MKKCTIFYEPKTFKVEQHKIELATTLYVNCIQSIDRKAAHHSYISTFQFELPPVQPITISIGVDIKDIPKVSDKDFAITLNAYFIVKWHDSRLIVQVFVSSNITQ